MLLGIPLDQMQGFHDRIIKAKIPHRQVIAAEENRHDPAQGLPFPLPVHVRTSNQR